MTMRSLISFSLVVGLCLALVACNDDKKAQQSMLPPVAVFDVTVADVPWSAEYQAQASGSRAVEVRARVEAIIEKRLYEEGDFVKQGQLLFQLERDQYEAKVQQAQAQFNNAEREWKRIRPLYEKNAVSQKERDNARAAYESAKAELRQARINLDYCQVTAPVSGYSSKENFTPGNLVGNNSLLTYVNQTDPMYIDFSIAAPERMRRQQLAAAGRLRFPDDGHYKAQLRLLDGSMYKGEGEVIMPGQYVRLFMEGDVLTNAVLIPQKCVLLTQKGALVMALDKDNKVFPVPVTLSVAVGDRYLVDSGLKGGERIISEGLVKARPGTQVRVQEPAAQQQQAQTPAAQK